MLQVASRNTNISRYVDMLQIGKDNLLLLYICVFCPRGRCICVGFFAYMPLLLHGSLGEDAKCLNRHSLEMKLYYQFVC